MKKMIVAAALALAVTASSRQEASAWCKFNFSAGFNLSYESTGSCYSWGFSCVPNPPPCGYGYGYGCPTYPSYAGYAASGYGNYAAPAAAPAAAAAPAYSQTQQVGYYFYNQGSAPSYWYGY